MVGEGPRWGAWGVAKGVIGPGGGIMSLFRSLYPAHQAPLRALPPRVPVPPPTVVSRAPQEAALHTQLHPHAPVPVLHASRREHLRQGRGALLRRHA